MTSVRKFNYQHRVLILNIWFVWGTGRGVLEKPLREQLTPIMLKQVHDVRFGESRWFIVGLNLRQVSWDQRINAGKKFYPKRHPVILENNEITFEA